MVDRVEPFARSFLEYAVGVGVALTRLDLVRAICVVLTPAVRTVREGLHRYIDTEVKRGVTVVALAIVEAAVAVAAVAEVAGLPAAAAVEAASCAYVIVTVPEET